MNVHFTSLKVSVKNQSVPHKTYHYRIQDFVCEIQSISIFIMKMTTMTKPLSKFRKKGHLQSSSKKSNITNLEKLENGTLI